MVLVELAEFDGTKIGVPDPIVDLLEADPFAFEDAADVDPGGAPANAGVGGDSAHLELGRIFDGR